MSKSLLKVIKLHFDLPSRADRLTGAEPVLSLHNFVAGRDAV